jgi:hypothetical protein
VSADPENSAPKQGGGQFQPGQSGNPAGKPRGTRHRALLALDAIGEGASKEILEAVIAAAKGGDMRASEILLRRIWPERKGRVVEFDLPPIIAPADAVKAVAAIVDAVAAGELTPEEAQAVAGVVEIQRRTIETEDLADRIAALEERTTL